MNSSLRAFKAKHVEKHPLDKSLHFFHEVFHRPFHSAIGLVYASFVALTFMSLIGFSTSDYLESPEILADDGSFVVAVRMETPSEVKGIANSVGSEGEVMGIFDIPVAQAAIPEACPPSVGTLPKGVTCVKTGNLSTDPRNKTGNDEAFNTYEFTNSKGQKCFQGSTGSYAYVFDRNTSKTMPLCSGGAYIARGKGNLGAGGTINKATGEFCFDRYNGDGSFARTVCQPTVTVNKTTNEVNFISNIYYPCNGKPVGTNGCIDFNPVTGQPLTKPCRIGAHALNEDGTADLTKPLDLSVVDCGKADNPLAFTPPVTGINTASTTKDIKGGCFYNYAYDGTAPRQICINPDGTLRQPSTTSSEDQLSFAIGQLMKEPFGEITVSNATTIKGWALDPQNLTQPLQLRVYIQKQGSATEEFINTVTAGEPTEPGLFPLEIPDKISVNPKGFSNHGFEFAPPAGSKVGDTIILYAVKSSGGWNPLIDARQIVAGNGTSEPPPGKVNSLSILKLIFNNAQPSFIPQQVTTNTTTQTGQSGGCGIGGQEACSTNTGGSGGTGSSTVSNGEKITVTGTLACIVPNSGSSAATNCQIGVAGAEADGKGYSLTGFDTTLDSLFGRKVIIIGTFTTISQSPGRVGGKVVVGNIAISSVQDSAASGGGLVAPINFGNTAYRPYGPEDPACGPLRESSGDGATGGLGLLYTYGGREQLDEKFDWKYVSGSAPKPDSTITLTVGAVSNVQGHVVLEGPNGVISDIPFSTGITRNNCYYGVTGHNTIDGALSENMGTENAQFEVSATGTYTATVYGPNGEVLKRDTFTIYPSPTTPTPSGPEPCPAGQVPVGLTTDTPPRYKCEASENPTPDPREPINVPRPARPSR